MARSLGAGLSTAISQIRTEPCWLIQIALSSTVRYTTGDAVTYNSNSFTAQDFRVSAATIGNAGANNASVTFQGVDETFTALFRQGDAEGSSVQIWQGDQGTSPFDAVQIIDSTIDQVTVTPDAVTLVLARQPIYAPYDRVNAAYGFTNLTTNTQQFPGGTQVLN